MFFQLLLPSDAIVLQPVRETVGRDGRDMKRPARQKQVNQSKDDGSGLSDSRKWLYENACKFSSR
jgi:hypothetical protein